MKILFLDYDGVINRFDRATKYATPVRMVGDIMTMAEPELVYRLNLIVDRTDAEIVLSSAWRLQKDWRDALRASGVFKNLLDRTPSIHYIGEGTNERRAVRGDEIQAWLDAHTHLNVERYAILDDESDMLPSQLHSFFRTDVAQGLTQEIADAVQRHLS